MRRRKPFGKLWRRALAATFAAALLVGACSGGESNSGSTGPVGAMAADVLAELEFLGDLAVVEFGPVTKPVGASGGSFDLPDGTIVDVPAWALPGVVELTVVILALDFAPVAKDPPSGKVYVLSTDDDVGLAQPVVLEVPRASGEVKVTQLVDGEWRRIEVLAGATTRVPITGFSTVPTAVVDASGPPERNGTNRWANGLATSLQRAYMPSTTC
jgi:hypothetical protein